MSTLRSNADGSGQFLSFWSTPTAMPLAMTLGLAFVVPNPVRLERNHLTDCGRADPTPGFGGCRELRDRLGASHRRVQSRSTRPRHTAAIHATAS